MLSGRRLPLVLVVAVVFACEAPAASDPPAVEPVPAASASPEPPAAPGPAVPADPSPANGEETLTADIVDTGPLGHGACNQRSYKVRPYDGTPELWIHFEHCGDAPGPDFGALHVGHTYRFRVMRGASKNFGDEPMIVAADPVDP